MLNEFHSCTLCREVSHRETLRKNSISTACTEIALFQSLHKIQDSR